MPEFDSPAIGKRVSIVIPCFNEEDVLPAAAARLLGVADSAPECEFEYIFVDDGSTDGSLNVLRSLANRDPRIRILTLARNFGHQVAVTAGIDVAIGDSVVLIDADLQDPPEVILQMLDKWDEGFDVVYGVRQSRPGETHFKRASANVFYRFLNRMSDVSIPNDTGDFRLIGRPVVEALKVMPEKHRFLRGMVAWTGFRQFALPYERDVRKAGVSKYPFKKMVNFACDAVFSFSTKPLQVATTIGLLASVLSVIGIVYVFVMRVFTSIWVEGWTALMIAVLFLGGVQLISLGVIGEYLGRVYEESKDRPLYLVRERIGFPEDTISRKTKTPSPQSAMVDG